MDMNLRALNRFGLGARIGERDEIGDPKGWLRAQLAGDGQVRLDGPGLDEIGGLLGRLREAQRSQDRDRIMEVNRDIRELRAGEATAMLTRRLGSDQPFVERLVAFWSNHLCVSALAKRQVDALAGHYEREAIRPHVLGRFDELVLASARHPAMLFYLDNVQSVGPGSVAGRRTARRGRGVGLNENYARELLELHTVGVDGGYLQEDVLQLARVLTGWTVAGVGRGGRADEPIGFVFRPAMHEPGRKTIMDRRYGEAGVAEGEQVIRDLCASEATADFVATKLVRHFVSDRPPEAAVQSVASTFMASGGDLRLVSESLIDLDDAWRPEHRKVRTPQDWLAAVFRSFGTQEAPQAAPQLLRQLGHAPWSPLAPNGFGDLQTDWTDPASLMSRAELARGLAGRVARNGRFDPRALLEVVEVEAGDPLESMLGDRSIPVPERVALALGGPAFQWR